jgi:hypothetical protein
MYLEPYLITERCMTMTTFAASEGALPGALSAVPLPEMSRRSFLKLLGATMVVMSLPSLTAAGDLALPKPQIPALSARPAEVPLQSLPKRATDLLQQAFDELRAHGFPFQLEQGSVYQHPERPTLYGLVLQDSLLAPRRQGADIAFTLDTEAAERSILSYIIGHSEDDGLHLATAVLTAQGIRSERRAIVLREQFPTMRAPARHILRNSLLANTWTTATDASAGAPVLVEHTAWHYDHSAGPLWTLVRGADGYDTPQLRLTTSQEYRDSRLVISGQARFDGWQSDVRTIVLNPSSWSYGLRGAD